MSLHHHLELQDRLFDRVFAIRNSNCWRQSTTNDKAGEWLSIDDVVPFCDCPRPSCTKTMAPLKVHVQY